MIRLTLAEGESIPEHSTNADLVVVVVKGEGIFYINQDPKLIRQGDAIDLTPNIPHAIDTKSDLELIVTHMHLASDQAEVVCGDNKCK